MAKKLKKGLFITLEGPEGSGKSTHSKRLYEELKKDGYPVIRTSEPGDTALGKKIREILLEKDFIKLDSYAELFLFEADRAQHVEEVIKPSLESCKIVICDRFNTATFAYQGYGLGLDLGLIERIDAAATGGLKPDMTLLLDVDVLTGLMRAGKVRSADRMEKRGAAFHGRVRRGYLEIAKKSRGKVKVINVKSVGETYTIIRDTVYGLIKRYKRAR
jgi:dTMP kinase